MKVDPVVALLFRLKKCKDWNLFFSLLGSLPFVIHKAEDPEVKEYLKRCSELAVRIAKRRFDEHLKETTSARGS